MTEEKNTQEDIEMAPDEEDAGATDDLKSVKFRADLKQCQTEKKEYLDGWQRAKADLINYKKDEAKRLDEIIKFAAEAVVAEVVQVLDSFDLALGHAMPKDVERGIVLIRSQLEDILRRRGLETIHALGEKFDPVLHEAIGEAESGEAEGTVVEELQKGYALNGKIIRPARVKISKHRKLEA